MIHLFAYGTLRDAEVRKGLLGRAVPGVPARVSGFTLERMVVGDEEFPCAVPGNGLLRGVVFDVTREEVARLDEYETQAYQRINARTTTDEDVQIYVRR